MRTDHLLFYLCSALIAIGVVFSLSLSAYVVLLFDTGHLHFFYRQAVVGIASIAIMWSLSQLNPDIWLPRIGLTLFVTMFFAMIFMHLLPASMITEVNGAARWIKFPLISIAPVEFFKIGFIYFLAWSFNRKIYKGEKSISEEFWVLLPYVVLFGFVAFLIAILQNDLGQVAVLAIVILAMSIFAGTSKKLVSSALALVMGLGIFFIFTSAHRIERVKSWWSGVQDIVFSFISPSLAAKLRLEDVDAPYQVTHSLNAINNGGLFGQGLGFGSFKLGFLSEVHTDFVLAGITEEIGILGVLFIVFIFACVVFRIFKISSRSISNVNYLFCIGIGMMFLFSFVINSYGITSISPVKGIAVPFLSYGGSHILASSIAVGLVLMASKRSKI